MREKLQTLPLAQLPEIYRENVGILTLGMVLS